MAPRQPTQGWISRVGSVALSGRRAVPIYVLVEVNQDLVSIEGVIGPQSRRGAFGPSGQINARFASRRAPLEAGELISAHAITFVMGWTEERWLDLLDIWSEYHGVLIHGVPPSVKEFFDSMPAADRPGAWRTLRALERETWVRTSKL